MAKGQPDSRPNFLIIMTDEHDPAVTGCYGHPTIRTPYLDRLGNEGVVFENAYCNSPICAPSRMAFLTGRYIHHNSVWDNSSELASEIPTFAHYLEAGGYEAALCGRMHINGKDRFHGFGKRLFEDVTSHTHPGKGPDRSKIARRGSASHVTDSGSGKGVFHEYDSNIADIGARYLESKAAGLSSEPFALVVGFFYPHFPLIAPRAYYDMYYPERVIMPESRHEPLDRQHPAVQQMRYFMRVDEDVPDEVIRRALAGYYGVISLTDDHIGRMLDVIDNSHLRDNTVVIYTSDHGESGGHHGLWQKNCFYEPSVRVPLIVRDPQGPRGKKVTSNATVADIMPSVLERAGIRLPSGLDGSSFLGLMNGAEDPSRLAFSEYHCQGMLNAGYMLRKGAYKYNYYVGYEPELYNVVADPEEMHNLAGDPQYASVRSELHQELLKLLDPEKVDQEAKLNQTKEAAKRTTWFDWIDFKSYIDKE
jgi:choline-sulfatase